MVARCIRASTRSSEIDGKQVVLRENKLYIDCISPDNSPFGHPFAGYYLPYPEENFEGLVSMITEEAPILNWIYVESTTYEVKYGVRVDAQPNFHGPFDCTRQDHRMTFDGWEGFCAVEETPGEWALYFDYNDDGLQDRVPPGTRVLEVVLTREEKRWARDPERRRAEQSTVQNLREPGSEPTPQTQAQGPEHIQQEPQNSEENPIVTPSTLGE